ncbi:MAG: flippase-like domain-containing protein [Anaerolineae bacterium]|nr:flippase-like domain-containing protein [Anaerolineae bacterium]
MNRRRITAFLGFLLTLIFGGLALYRLDLREVGSALLEANYLFVVPALLVTFCGYLLRAARWRVILLPSKEVSAGRVFPPLIIGFAVNNLLPARMGEFARAYLLGEKEEISKSLSFATVVVERILDGLTLIFSLFLVSLLFALPGWGRKMGLFSLLFFGGALAFLFLLLYGREQTLRVVKRLATPLDLADRATQVADSFVEGVEALRRRHLIPSLVLLSTLVWSCETTSYLLLTLAFPISLSPLTRVVAAVFVMVVANLGVLIPSSPGYIGTFHFFAMSALAAFGAPRETALSYAVVSHAMQYLLVTGLGLLFLWRENISLFRIRTEVITEG